MDICAFVLEENGHMSGKQVGLHGWGVGQMHEGPSCIYMQFIQWVKKLSQCLAVSERVICNKSNKLHKNVKIIYVIV